MSHADMMRDFIDEAWFSSKEFEFAELGELFLAVENVCDTLYVDSGDDSESERLKVASQCASVAYHVLDGGQEEKLEDVLMVVGLLRDELGRYLDENQPRKGKYDRN